MIVRETRVVDKYGRILLPKSLVRVAGLEGAEVYFELTKSGNVVIRKANKGKEKGGSSSD